VQAKNEDRQALEALVCSIQDKTSGLALQMLNDLEDAEDEQSARDFANEMIAKEQFELTTKRR
jgi:hypothetical protein